MLRRLLATRRLARGGFSIVEVMIAAALVALGLGSIAAMAAKSIRILRSTRQVVASSNILQQRIEMIRAKPWPEVSNASALAIMMRTPTQSEAELADPSLVERVTVRVPDSASPDFSGDTRSFTVTRQRGFARAEGTDDFGREPTLLFESSLVWQDMEGNHERKLRTVVSRTGLTRSGIFGSSLGRPRNR